MNTFHFFKSIPVVAALLVSANVSFGQMASQSPAGADATLMKLFGDIKAFSAVCDMRMLDPDGSPTFSGPMDFALLDGKMCVEVDLLKMTAKDMPPGAAEAMKQAGMDRVISIVRTDKKNQAIIYPGLKSCVEMPLPKKQADALDDKSSKIEKSELGKEKIDGRDCTKNKVVIKNDKGETQEFTVWNAADLKDFPVQIETVQDGQKIVMLFKQVKLDKPAAAKFEIPADYKKYDDMGSFMQAMMARMMSGGQ
ncbi:MAG TPA: DUF4412 domain-containing protein [Verrucomicrobiota bacterium]|nr:DUF4412 domain-containing protein [Verrucomicrobiota bacterium]